MTIPESWPNRFMFFSLYSWITLQVVACSKLSVKSVYAKTRPLQVNVRQNLSATGRNFGFTCHNDPQILLYI